MFSYNPSDLSTSLNQVRRLIGDVSSTAPEFQDEEVNFFLDQAANIFGAAAICCQALSTKYAQQVDKSVGDLSISASQKYAHYSELADSYEGLAKSKGAPRLYAGGISIADKKTQTDDTDRVAPDFTRDKFEYVTGTSS